MLRHFFDYDPIHYNSANKHALYCSTPHPYCVPYPFYIFQPLSLVILTAKKLQQLPLTVRHLVLHSLVPPHTLNTSNFTRTPSHSHLFISHALPNSLNSVYNFSESATSVVSSANKRWFISDLVPFAPPVPTFY